MFQNTISKIMKYKSRNQGSQCFPEFGYETMGHFCIHCIVNNSVRIPCKKKQKNNMVILTPHEASQCQSIIPSHEPLCLQALTY